MFLYPEFDFVANTSRCFSNVQIELIYHGRITGEKTVSLSPKKSKRNDREKNTGRFSDHVCHMGDPTGLPGNKILEYAQPR